MASWKLNPIMEWSEDGTNWIKVTDHGRSELDISTEQIETKQRMVNATMRKYVVAKKRTFSCSWDNLPDKAVSFLSNGTTHGNWLETFYNRMDGAFYLRLRSGSDINNTTISRNGTNVLLEDNARIFTVMFSEFSKTVVKRGRDFDMWNVSISLEEV